MSKSTGIASFVMFALTLGASAVLLSQTPAAPPATPAPDVAGIWRCEVDYSGTTVDIGVHLAKGDAGALTASVDNVMDPGAPPMAASATFHEGQLHVDVPDLPSSFDGKINPAGDTIEGAWTYDGGSIGCSLLKDKATP